MGSEPVPSLKRTLLRAGDIIVATAVVVAASTAAAHAEALHDHDNSPFAGLMGLPDATEGGKLLDRGRGAWTVLVQTASHSVADAGGGEFLIVDGETSRLELSYRRGIGERWELGVEFPYLTHQPGSLDSLIDEFHELFGLPDGVRDSRPRDVLEFRYTVDGAARLDVRQSSHGAGDVRLFGGYALANSPTRGTALRFGIKLPTGEARHLHGSGATDISVGIAGDLRELGRSGSWSAFWRLHALWVGEPNIFADLYEELVVSGTAGVAWQLTPRVGLTVQASGRSPQYESRINVLGEPAFALMVGGDIRLSERWQLQFAVGEDIKVETTPDVTFQVALDYRPD